MLLLVLIITVLYGTVKTIKNLFCDVSILNRCLLFLVLLGFFVQFILFEKKLFHHALSFTIFVTIILSLLFNNHEKIRNKEFNDFVIMFLVGQAAFCMIASNQKDLYEYDFFYSVIYAGIYIGIPMFMALKFTSKPPNSDNDKEIILKKLKEIENKLNNLSNVVDKSKFNKKNCSIFSKFLHKRNNK
ncbi:hypothetical protein NYR78_10385 [Actinobacillus equuli subsp. haemolyticus]|nr:hypothetical protein NYR78_10385 [Actinobacillus equuli subsp. haemolyticus]